MSRILLVKSKFGAEIMGVLRFGDTRSKTKQSAARRGRCRGGGEIINNGNLLFDCQSRRALRTERIARIGSQNCFNPSVIGRVVPWHLFGQIT